ncbi:MAG: tetratricopeptide repeat protein [Pseudomonadota bacterium]
MQRAASVAGAMIDKPLGYRRKGRSATPVVALLIAIALAGCDDDRPSPALLDFEAALQEIEAGDTVEAERRLHQAIEADPTHAQSFAALGRIAEGRGQIAAALSYYEAARAADETSPEGHWQLSRLALERGLLAEALRHCTAAQHLGPTEPAVMTLRSRVMQRVGLLVPAEETARAAVGLPGTNVAAKVQLAAVRAAREGAAAGLAVLREAEAIGAPVPPGPKLRLYDGMGRPDDAINMLSGQLVDAQPALASVIVPELARRLLQAGRLDDAETVLEAHLIEQPDNFEALGMLARIVFAREGAERARQRVRSGSALASHSNDEGVAELLAMISRMDEGTERPGAGRAVMPSLPSVSRRVAVPLASLETALAEAGAAASPYLRALVGEARAAAGDSDGASAAFEQAMGESLASTAVLEVYARALRAAGDSERAIGLLKQYSSEREGDRRLSALLGAHQLASGRHDAVAVLAVGSLADAALSGVPNPMAEVLLGAAIKAALAADQSEAALSYTQDAIAVHELSAGPRLARVQVLMHLGRAEEAARTLETAIALEPGRPAAYLQLARLMGRESDNAALEVLERGLQRSVETMQLRLERAVRLERLARRDEAQAEYETLHAIDPAEPVVVNNLASLLSGGPRLDDVDEQRLRRADTLASRLSAYELPEFLDTRGWIALKRGDVDAAVSLLEEAALKRPNQPVIHYHLGIAYYRSGQRDQAERSLRHMLSLDSDRPIEYENEAVRVLAKVERQGEAARHGVD